jgi:hypothetical protein
VLDVVEGIVSETVIELMREEKGIKDKKCIHEQESERCDTLGY